MNNRKIKIRDKYTHKVLSPKRLAGIQLIGKVTHRVNDKIILVQSNTINANLFTYLRNSMSSNVNKAIDDLFTASQIAPGGAQDGKDGIAFFDSEATVYQSMATITGAETETYGRRWIGTVEMDQPRTITGTVLGHSYQAGSPTFDTLYATQSFTGITLPSGSLYEVDWEIFLQIAT